MKHLLAAVALILPLSSAADANGNYKRNNHVVQPWCTEYDDELYPHDFFRREQSEWGPCWAWDGQGGLQPTNGPSSMNSQRPNPQEFNPPPGY